MNIEIRVIPKARKREIKRSGMGLRVKVMAPPAEGKANDELIRYLAKVFAVRRSDIKILRGDNDRTKLVSIPIENEQLQLLPLEEGSS
jgi:uncharacterized protein (TIGR00251 family)